jgi:predicted dehydrogenase
MKQVRVGVIGVGYLGKFHAEKYSRMDNVQLTGVVDIDHSLAEEIATGFNTRVFGNYRDLYGHVDAVSIVVPTEDHFSIAADCLKHDLDLLIETD